MKFRVRKKREKLSEKLRGTDSARYDWFKTLLNIRHKGFDFDERNIKRAYRYHQLPKNEFKRKSLKNILMKDPAIFAAWYKQNGSDSVKQPVYIVPEKLRGVPIKENLEEAMDILTKENREEI